MCNEYTDEQIAIMNGIVQGKDEVLRDLDLLLIALYADDGLDAKSAIESIIQSHRT